jgi:high-affinity K+ transport system ATPase subunit B
VLGVVRNLTIVNFAIVVGMVAYAHAIAMSTNRIIPLVLTALLSAVPVALPATFTLAATLGAKALALKGVLLTRLSALHEAAMIDVLCADKTGTLTANELAVSAVRPLERGYSEEDVLAVAALASSADGRDPIDAVIRSMAQSKGPSCQPPEVLRFTPFDPAAKMAEAIAIDDDGREMRVVKGAPAAVAAVAPMTHEIDAEVQRLAATGYRTLGVACGPPGKLAFIGLIAFGDPPRPDSRALLAQLRSLGVRTVMITGDAAATAVTVARAVGLEGPVCPPGKIPDSIGPEDFAVYAGVFPEEKFRLVKAFQQRGHAVGMCGDGATGRAVAAPQCLAHPQAHPRGNPLGLVQALILRGCAGDRLVYCGIGPRWDANPHRPDAGLRGSGDCLCVARARPFLELASCCDHAFGFVGRCGDRGISLAIGGLLMTPLPPEIVGILLIATLAFALALDFVKIAVFSRLRID